MSSHRKVAALRGLLGVALPGFLALSASAQPTLFNTGVDGTGTPLANGSTDPHYTVVENGNANAIVVSNQAPGPYAQSPNAKWIWQTAGGTPGSVVRTFRQIFDLTGFNPSSAQITGQYAIDNLGSIQLNGVTVGTASPGFTSYTPFTINSNFLPGINTLDFVATDQGAPGGLNVTNLVLTASVVGGAAPEPGTVTLFALGSLTAALIVRRRK